MAHMKMSGVVMLTEFTYTLPKNNLTCVFIGKLEMIEGYDIMNGSRSCIAHQQVHFLKNIQWGVRARQASLSWWQN